MKASYLVVNNKMFECKDIRAGRKHLNRFKLTFSTTVKIHIP